MCTASESVFALAEMSDAERMNAATFMMPRTISMSATENSILKPRRAGMTTLNRIIMAPTAKIVRVCPTPQNAPVIAARLSWRWRVTMVVTAITWSGSVAWRIPRKNPTAIIEKKLPMASLVEPFDQAGCAQGRRPVHQEIEELFLFNPLLDER